MVELHRTEVAMKDNRISLQQYDGGDSSAGRSRAMLDVGSVLASSATAFNLHTPMTALFSPLTYGMFKFAQVNARGVGVSCDIGPGR